MRLLLFDRADDEAAARSMELELRGIGDSLAESACMAPWRDLMIQASRVSLRAREAQYSLTNCAFPREKVYHRPQTGLALPVGPGRLERGAARAGNVGANISD
jgi:hypothetical protein